MRRPTVTRNQISDRADRADRRVGISLESACPLAAETFDYAETALEG